MEAEFDMEKVKAEVGLRGISQPVANRGGDLLDVIIACMHGNDNTLVGFF